MKITKGVIGRREATRISPEYVRFAADGDMGALGAVLRAFAGLRRGQRVLTRRDGEFVMAEVTSVDHLDHRAVDGPVVRVGDGERTWRVDGCGYAFPAPKGAKA